jgi:S-disulfanyl-L-cysteine oxidoreductase SoxD
MRRPLITMASSVAVAVVVVAAALIAGLATPSTARQNTHFANAQDDASVLHGKQVYMRNCASCHGRSLQGQPLWQLMDEYAGRRAPAHDQTGHTWQHSDEALFHFTKYGRWDPSGPPTYMPPFENRLNDADILAALGFIKRSWPIGLRVSQAMLNPGQAGMPRNAANVDWSLPPTTCRGSAIARGLE